MVVTRYFRRTIFTYSTLKPLTIEYKKGAYEYRAKYYAELATFESHFGYTDRRDGCEITVKVHSFAGESIGIIQFFEITGEEEAVQKEAEYICSI